MAVDLHMLETEESHEGGDGNKKEQEPPATTTPIGGDTAAEAVVYKKGAWSKEEDEKLRGAVDKYGLRNWVAIEKFSGLGRPAKNCRLRWLNYLRPNLKKYPFTQEEEDLIFQLHSKYGNSWSRIASKLPGRSDNEIKNFWHKKAKKRHKHHLPIYPTTKENHQIQNHTSFFNTISHNNFSDNQSNSRNEHSTQNDDVQTNYPKQTIPSELIHSPQIQPSTPNAVNMSSRPNDASIHSPQTAISTPQPQFHCSPSSSHIQQSPANTLTDQATPNSQTQNLFLSPQPRTQPTETPFPLPNASPHIHVLSMGQTGASENEFTVLREPPILSSPQGRLRRFSRTMSKLSPNSAYSDASNVSTFIPQDSSPRSARVSTQGSLQMQFSSATESPRSPLKLKLSPRVPTQGSLQMNVQMTDPQTASFHGFQLQSPNATPLSPLKLRLSIPTPPESFFQSSLSITNSTVQLSPSTALVSLSSPELNPPSCGPPVQRITIDTDNIIPQDSAQAIQIEPPSVQVEYDSSSEIMEELREAQARVKFLKKKLNLRRTSNKKRLQRGSSEIDLMQDSLDRDSRENITKGCTLRRSSETEKLLDDVLRVKKPLKDSKKYMLKKFPSSKKSETIMDAWGKSKLCKQHKREHLEIEKCKQGSIESEKATCDENLEAKTTPQGSLQRFKEYSIGEIFERKNSMTSHEQRQSIDSFDHLNILSTMNPRNSSSFANKLCHFQGAPRKCLNECSTMDVLYTESSNLLQDGSLQGAFFGQRCATEDQLSWQRHVPPIDTFNPVYSQSTPTTLVKPSDEIDRLTYLQSDQVGYFRYSFGQEISDIPERKMTENGLVDGNESNLLRNQHLVSAPIIEQEYFRGEEFSLHGSGSRNSAGTSNPCEPNILQHQLPSPSSTNLIDNLVDSVYLVDFQQECSQSEQYILQSFAAGEFDRDDVKIECFSRETWKHEPSREQSLMHDLMADDLWPEDQVVSQDHTLSAHRFHSSVFDAMESKNWNDELGCDHAGDVPKHEGEHDHMSTMSEELTNLLDFFPTNNETLEWYNIGNAIHDAGTSDEFEMGFDLQRLSTSRLPLTTADYI